MLVKDVAQTVVGFRSEERVILHLFVVSIASAVRTDDEGYFKLPPLRGEFKLEVTDNAPDYPKRRVLRGKKPPEIDPVVIDTTAWNEEELIAAVDRARSIPITPRDRFLKGKEFVQSCLDRTVKIGDTNNPLSGPHFCCSFTFFPHFSRPNPPFPAATIFLPRLQVIKKNDSCLLIVNLLLNNRENLKILNKKIKDKILTIDG